MRKTLAVLAALLVLLTFSACGEKENAYDLYVKGSEEILKAESMSVNAKLKTKMQGAGINQELDVAMSMKMTMKNGKTEAEVITSGEQFGLPGGSITIYIKDNQTYLNMQGQKMKMQLPETYLNGITANSKPVELPASAVKNQKVEDVNGKKKLTMTISGESMMETVNAQMGELLAAYPGTQMTVGDVIMEAVIGSSGQLETVNVKINVSVTITGQTLTMDMELDAEYVQVGNVTIEFPADLDTYTEVNLTI